MANIKTLTIAAITIFLLACSAAAETLTLRTPNGNLVKIERSNIWNVTSADLRSAGSAKCNYVYYMTDTNEYILGGCNRDYSAAGAQSSGAVICTGPHGRLHLTVVKSGS